MMTIAEYTLPVRPSPSTCEDLQRELDAIDPRYLLNVQGRVASILAPYPDHRVLQPFYRFTETVKDQEQRMIARGARCGIREIQVPRRGIGAR